MTTKKEALDRRWLALALVAMAQFMVVLDASIVNVALPSIGTDLSISPENLSWVINAYVLTFGGFLLLGGRIADLLGRRRVFISGLVLFSVASLVGGFANSEAMLIAARAAQGLGGAIIAPAVLAIIATTFKDGSERNKALGVIGAVAGSGGAVGVLLGGVLTESLGWEWVLWVNVPIGIAAAALAPVLISESRAELGHRSFDIAGAFSVTAGLSLLVYALVRAAEVGWGSVENLALLGGAVALLVAFVLIELRSKAPLVNFKIFRLRTLTGANSVGLMVGAALFSVFFFMSLYMQQVLGYTPIETGLAYLPLALAIIASAAIASQLVTKVGFKPVLVTGLITTAVGLLWLSRIPVDGTFVGAILFPEILLGLGLGLAFVPITIAAVTGVADHEAGLASGLINTSQQIGGALGLAVLVSIASSETAKLMSRAGNDPAAYPGALTEGFQTAILVGAGFAIAGLALALTLIRGTDSKNHVALSRPPAPTPEPAESTT